MTYHAYTTLNEIRETNPCKDDWNKLLENLGKTKADDEPLHLLTILDSIGFDDALWCLQAKSLNRLSRHFQAWCAEQVLHHFESEYPNDTRIREQIAMLRNDDATQEEHEAAGFAAWVAALEAAHTTPHAAQEAQLRAMIGENHPLIMEIPNDLTRMITLDDIRRGLVPTWEYALPVVDAIEARSCLFPSYNLELNLWLSGEKSTVHFRDVIMEPLRYLPEIIAIGKQFNPTTEWHNTWMPLDTAIFLARQRKEMEERETALNPVHFGPYLELF